MTVALDLALLSQPAMSVGLTGFAGPTGASEPAESGDLALQFADLLASRALLEAPAAATGGGLDSAIPGQVQEAPAALQFDEAPLFGRAFLAGRTAAGSPGTALAASPQAAAPVVVEKCTPCDSMEPPGAPVRRASDRVSARFVAPGESFGPSGGADPLIANSAAVAAAWISPTGLSGIAHGPAVPGGGSEIAAVVSLSPAAFRDFAVPGAPGLVRPAAIAIARIRAARTSPFSVPAQDSGFESLADKAREMRASLVDRLGPVHVVLRQEGAALVLTARVAALAADREQELGRRLREAAGEEDWSLAALTVNGHAQPTAGGS